MCRGIWDTTNICKPLEDGVQTSLTTASGDFRKRERERGLAVTPHSLLGCQNERGEAGQRLGQFQEWMLQTGTVFYLLCS